MIKFSQNSNEEELPAGSGLAEFVEQLQILSNQEFSTTQEALEWMVQRTFVFVKRKIGRSESESWFPISLKENPKEMF